jgi:predicted CopG family antitoxin
VSQVSVRLNITIDKDLYKRLKSQLPPKGISSFISDAVRARLYPDKRTLDAAYKKARRERWRRQIGEEWKVTEAEDWPE